MRCNRAQWVSGRAEVPALVNRPFRLLRDRFWPGDWAGPYEAHYAALVSIWVRWCVAALCVASEGFSLSVAGPDM